MKFYVSILAIITSIFSHSQDIQGEIKSQKNTPIENATLYNLNNHSHFHSDEEGKFTLENTKIGDTIRISKLGYIEKKNHDTISIVFIYSIRK